MKSEIYRKMKVKAVDVMNNFWNACIKLKLREDFWRHSQFSSEHDLNNPTVIFTPFSNSIKNQEFEINIDARENNDKN